MTELILGLFNAFAPIVRDIVERHHAATGQMPTDAEIAAAFNAHVDTFLEEGRAWRAAHPKGLP